MRQAGEKPSLGQKQLYWFRQEARELAKGNTGRGKTGGEGILRTKLPYSGAFSFLSFVPMSLRPQALRMGTVLF